MPQQGFVSEIKRRNNLFKALFDEQGSSAVEETCDVNNDVLSKLMKIILKVFLSASDGSNC